MTPLPELRAPDFAFVGASLPNRRRNRQGSPARDSLVYEGIAMSQLVPPHGSETVKPLLLPEAERSEEMKRAKELRKVPLDSRAVSDVFMLAMRSEARRVGKGWVSTCRSRW